MFEDFQGYNEEFSIVFYIIPHSVVHPLFFIRLKTSVVTHSLVLCVSYHGNTVPDSAARVQTR